MQSLVALLVVATAPWRDPRIHNLGNVGVRGGLHAALAPLSTRIIDEMAYGGRNLRTEVLRTHVPEGARAVDLCCGVGYSTTPGGLGVDASEQMLGIARLLHAQEGDDAHFVCGDAETWRPVGEAPDNAPAKAPAFDVATCFFALHEMPGDARRRVLANMLALAPTALVVDISPDYTPSESMLSGEPYLLEYQAHVDADVVAVADEAGAALERTVLVPGHAVLWTLSTACHLDR